MSYLLDSNVLITAKNLYYGIDFCPGFWDWIKSKANDGLVKSIGKVKDEVTSGDDELVKWIRQLPKDFFLQPQQSDVEALQRISSWVTSGTYEQAAITQFLQVADYYLCAQALGGGHTVVTLETPAEGRRKVKIPSVCIALGIPYTSTFNMLRHEQIRLVTR
jgi:hypothetical protein